MNQFVDVCLLSIVNNKLSVLLIKRGFEPFKDMYALPGRKYQSNLSPLENAQLSLSTELGLKDIYLDQLKTYGSMTRDPRGASLSVCYLALVDYKNIHAVNTPDAVESKWVAVDELFKTAIAFDHKEMILDAVARIKNQIRYTKVGFSLIGNDFTIKEIVETFEQVLGIKIDPSNLRKKLLSLNLLSENPQRLIKGKGRPQPIYNLNQAAFKALETNESFF